MSFPFTHALTAYLPAKLLERYARWKIPQHAFALLLFGAIVPDLDYLIDWGFGTHIHRTLSHSLLGVLLFSVVVAVLLSLKKVDWKKGTVAFAAGMLSHMLSDLFFGPILFFWPLSFSFSLPLFPVGTLFDGELWRLKYALLDISLGIAFIAFLYIRKKVKF